MDDKSIGQRAESKGQLKRALTVSEAAEMLGVDRQTIKKYMALNPEDEAPIPFDAWYRLPGGHIRIYRWGVEALKR